MRHDPVTNVMATVIPCPKAQAELVKQFHLEYDSHPHYRILERAHARRR